ncbi:Coenzyme F420 hydrogenase/dehydrogenase, beta subunit C-terminal domain [Methanococcus aeolicus]|uniref:Coenzyme F420 hydrogenase/dehydrogenase, beta subunit C-terminal domain n=1 Tax=Methanococcus aeolicus TaxID=42879 RepID=UPI0021C86456|nr:Coenzyme F420 hydrogenase/dehydrogenase, beta subunit C-terminal domain [Methanococcus aeolicus]UXM84510.1 Coenzyme F420 hydrogenase/dehydrogenase, beta subunit C-terminal domain [Methanococcus aeolicus]
MAELNIKECLDNKLCSFCGACISVCPSNALITGVDAPDIENKGFCETCEKNLCKSICPQIDIEEQLYGKNPEYEKIIIAKSKIGEILKNCQDGGITSTLLYTLLEEESENIKCICAGNQNDWKPETIVAECKEDILKTLGSKYTFVPVLSKLHDEVIYKDKKIAVVGLPCQLRALHNMETIHFRKYRVDYKIGILCTHNFPYNMFKKIIEDLGLKVEDVVKVDINKGKMIFYTEDGEKSLPVSELDDFCDDCCHQCPELYSNYADVNVGSMGSPDGWNTVFIMNEKGNKLFKKAVDKGYIEISENMEEVKIQKGLAFLNKFTGIKQSKAKKFVDNADNNVGKITSSRMDILELFNEREKYTKYYEAKLGDISANILSDREIENSKNKNLKEIYIEPKYCIGCRACEISCNMDNGENRVDVVQIDDIFYTPVKCMHCAEAPCVKACPENALLIENELVVVDNDRCIGCKMCITICPYGHPKIKLAEDSIEISVSGLPKPIQKYNLVKCNGCIDKIAEGGAPNCYSVCPTDALNIENSKIKDAAKNMIINKF